jgi:hypothetical protein
MRTASGPVFELDPDNSGGPARYRRTRVGWSKVSLSGEPLNARELSSALTRQLDWRDFETLVDLIFARGGLAAEQHPGKAAALTWT